jgi:hypothetical protein
LGFAPFPDPGTSLQTGEKANNPWIGRTIAELERARGSPILIIDTRPLGIGYPGQPLLLASLYSSNGKTCIDAYVYDPVTTLILRYHCR